MPHYNHVNRAPPDKWATFNLGGTRLVESAVREAIGAFRLAGRSDAIRVLDIGCGVSPYLIPIQAESPGELAILLRDKNKSAFDKHPLTTADTSATDFFDLVGDHTLFKGEPCEIVVLAFVLHELRIQMALRRLNVDGSSLANDNFDPAVAALRLLEKAAFVGPHTKIILADVFNWRFWGIDKLEEARARQETTLGHADSPLAFLSGEKVVGHARSAGFELITYNEGASVDVSDPHMLCGDPEYGYIFQNRRAFCATLKRGQVTVRKSLPDVIQTKLAAQPGVQKENFEYLGKLRQFLLVKTEQTVDRSAYDALLGLRLFRNLTETAGELARDWFKSIQVPAPATIACWFGINSLVFKEDPKNRYALKNGDKWLCHLAHLLDVKITRDDTTRDQEWSSLCFNLFCSPEAVRHMTGAHTWLQDLAPPSIYRWMTSQSNISRPWRSVSIVCRPLDKEEGDAAQAPNRMVEDALALYDYTPLSRGLHGHLLIALRADEDHAYELGKTLDGMCPGYCADQGSEHEALAGGAYREQRRAVLHAISSVYIDALFLGRSQTEHESPREIRELCRRFRQRWTDEARVYFFSPDAHPAELDKRANGRALLPAEVRGRIDEFIKHVDDSIMADCNPCWVGYELPVVWTSFVVKQPGSDASNVLGAEPIATIMLISDRPWHPALLELFTAQFEELCFSIRAVEAEYVVKLHSEAEGRSHAVQTMTQSFGHDGGKHATAISLALSGRSNIGAFDQNERMAIGCWLAANLKSRLFAYQTLIGEGISNQFYKDERSRKRNEGVVSLVDLIRREVAFVILRCAVDESEWQVLARKLQLKSVRSALIQFVLDASADGKLYPSGALAQLEKSIGNLVVLSWKGFDGITIPTTLQSDGNRTAISRISAGLGFILSELLTNIFRHQYAEFPESDIHLPVRLSFSLHKDQNRYNLEVRSSPAHLPYTQHLKPNPTGLASLVYAAQALGVRIPEKVVETSGKLQSLPFPNFDAQAKELSSWILEISEEAFNV